MASSRYGRTDDGLDALHATPCSADVGLCQESGNTIALPAGLRDALGEPGNLVLWVGAGISSPSGLPLGDELTGAVLRAVFGGFARDYTAEACRILGKVHARNACERQRLRCKGRYPRLEFVLECVTPFLSPEQDGGLRCLFGLGNPNRLHTWVAGMAAEGAVVVTPNMDGLLERAGCPDDAVYHYHGIHSSADWGGVLRNLADPASVRGTADRLDGLLGQRTIVFLGYSGRDYYDITPFFRERPRRFSRGLWVEYGRGLPMEKVNDPARTMPEVHMRTECVRSAFAPGGMEYYRGDSAWLVGVPELPTHGCPWREAVVGALSGVGEIATGVVAADLLMRIGLWQPGVALVAEAEETRQDRPDLGDTRRRAVALAARKARLLHIGGRYQASFREARERLRCSRGVATDEDRSLLGRCISDSLLYGLFLLYWPRQMWRGIRVSRSLSSLVTLHDYHRANADLQILYQPVDALRRCRLGSLPPLRQLLEGLKGRYLEGRVAMRDQYQRAVSGGQLRYDEELSQSLQTQADRTDPETDQRWMETDSVRQAMIHRRNRLHAVIKTAERVPPYSKLPLRIRREIVIGVRQSCALANCAEMLDWSVLAQRYVVSSRGLWAMLIEKASRDLQTPMAPVTRRLRVWQSRQKAERCG
jgi:hypothetical protein